MVNIKITGLISYVYDNDDGNKVVVFSEEKSDQCFSVVVDPKTRAITGFTIVVYGVGIVDDKNHIATYDEVECSQNDSISLRKIINNMAGFYYNNFTHECEGLKVNDNCRLLSLIRREDDHKIMQFHTFCVLGNNTIEFISDSINIDSNIPRNCNINVMCDIDSIELVHYELNKYSGISIKIFTNELDVIKEKN